MNNIIIRSFIFVFKIFVALYSFFIFACNNPFFICILQFYSKRLKKLMNVVLWTLSLELSLIVRTKARLSKFILTLLVRSLCEDYATMNMYVIKTSEKSLCAEFLPISHIFITTLRSSLNYILN
jgi:hypothetical protein